MAKNRMIRESRNKKTLSENGTFSIVPEFINLCKMTQEQLKGFLPLELMANGYTDIVVGDGYIYARGTIPVLLTAHMDTVHASAVHQFYEMVIKGKHVISSPQGIGGDDRCGIYMILEIIKEYKCSVLFCEDEEGGGIGSSKFCKTSFIAELMSMNYLIELDRANSNDAVFYSCDNPEFTEFIIKGTGYREAYGSFSDISIIAPACGVAAVNLSCGYYHAHTPKEEVVVEEMLNTIKVVKQLLLIESKQYEYIEQVYEDWWSYNNSAYGYGYRSSKRWYCNEDFYSPRKLEDKDTTVHLLVYVNGLGEDSEYYASSSSLEGAWCKFFHENGDICFNDIYDFEVF